MVSIAGKIRSSAGSLVPKPVTIDYDKHIMQALLHRIYMVGTWCHNIFGCLSASGVPRFVAFDQVALSIEQAVCFEANRCKYHHLHQILHRIWTSSPKISELNQTWNSHCAIAFTFFFILPSDPAPVLQECVYVVPCHLCPKNLAWLFEEAVLITHLKTARSFLLNEGHVNLAESHHYHLNILISLLSFEALQHPWFWWCLGLNQGPSAKLLDELCLQGGFHSALPCYCTGCTGCTLFARTCNVQNSHTKQWSIMRYTRYYQSFNDSMYSRSSRSPSSRTFFSRSVMLLKAPLPPLFESNIRECKCVYIYTHNYISYKQSSSCKNQTGDKSSETWRECFIKLPTLLSAKIWEGWVDNDWRMSHTNSFDVILVISGHFVNGEAFVLGQRLHSLCCCRRKLCQRHSRLLLSISPAWVLSI